MPKTTKSIVNFARGLMTFANPRDLDDSSVADSCNFQFDSLGTASISGRAIPIADLNSDNSQITAASSFYSFRANNSIYDWSIGSPKEYPNGLTLLAWKNGGSIALAEIKADGHIHDLSYLGSNDAGTSSDVSTTTLWYEAWREDAAAEDNEDILGDYWNQWPVFVFNHDSRVPNLSPGLPFFIFHNGVLRTSNANFEIKPDLRHIPNNSRVSLADGATPAWFGHIKRTLWPGLEKTNQLKSIGETTDDEYALGLSPSSHTPSKLDTWFTHNTNSFTSQSHFSDNAQPFAEHGVAAGEQEAVTRNVYGIGYSTKIPAESQDQYGGFDASKRNTDHQVDTGVMIYNADLLDSASSMGGKPGTRILSTFLGYSYSNQFADLNNSASTNGISRLLWDSQSDSDHLYAPRGIFQVWWMRDSNNTGDAPQYNGGLTLDDDLKRKWRIGVSEIWDDSQETNVLPSMTYDYVTGEHVPVIMDFVTEATDDWKAKDNNESYYIHQLRNGVDPDTVLDGTGIGIPTNGFDNDNPILINIQHLVPNFKQDHGGCYYNPRIVGFNIYMQHADDSNSDWHRLANFDCKNSKLKVWGVDTGVYKNEFTPTTLDGDAGRFCFTEFDEGGNLTLVGTGHPSKIQNWCVLAEVPPLTYNDINGHDSGVETRLRYKTAAMLGEVMYAGNIMRPDGSIHPNLMVRSAPNYQFDKFPEDEYFEFEVASDDGDEIIHMEVFGDRLLQFKRNILYVVKVDEDGGMSVEYKRRGLGVDRPSQVVNTRHGIIWIGKTGVFKYAGEIEEGESIVNLIDKKIKLGEDYIFDRVQNRDANHINLRTQDSFADEESWGVKRNNSEYSTGYDGWIRFMKSGHLQMISADSDIVTSAINFSTIFGDEWVETKTKVSEEGLDLSTGYLKGSSDIPSRLPALLKKGGHNINIGAFINLCSNSPIVGYDFNKDMLLIRKSCTPNDTDGQESQCYRYHFPTQTWSFTTNTRAGAYTSNFANDKDGNLLFISNMFHGFPLDDGRIGWSNKKSQALWGNGDEENMHLVDQP